MESSSGTPPSERETRLESLRALAELDQNLGALSGVITNLERASMLDEAHLVFVAYRRLHDVREAMLNKLSKETRR